MGLPAHIREGESSSMAHLSEKNRSGRYQAAHEETGCRKKLPPQHRATPVFTCNNSRMRPFCIYVAMLYGTVSQCKQNRRRRPVSSRRCHWASAQNQAWVAPIRCRSLRFEPRASVQASKVRSEGESGASESGATQPETSVLAVLRHGPACQHKRTPEGDGSSMAR